MISKSLTVWINQPITQYKVLNLLQVPYHLKISFNSRKHAYGSYYFVTSSMRLRDHGEAVIEFICFNKWNEAKPRWTSWCWVNPNINEWYYSCRLGSAAFKLAETYWLRVRTWLQIPKFVCLDSCGDSTTFYGAVHASMSQIYTLKNII